MLVRSLSNAMYSTGNNSFPASWRAYPELKIDLVCNDRDADFVEEGFYVATRLARSLATTVTMRVFVNYASEVYRSTERA